MFTMMDRAVAVFNEREEKMRGVEEKITENRRFTIIMNTAFSTIRNPGLVASGSITTTMICLTYQIGR